MNRPGTDREVVGDGDRLGTDRGQGLAGQTDRDGELTLSEERLRVGTETEHLGTARAVKRVDTETVHTRVDRGTEHADTERVEVLDAETDSGEVETLPDGSVSIPVFEEQIVVTKRLVVRERVVIRKHTVYEDHVVTADLRRERLEVVADAGVVVHDADQGTVHGTDTGTGYDLDRGGRT
jgi:uncharacterized protein (TIGR02271 family)